MGVRVTICTRRGIVAWRSDCRSRRWHGCRRDILCHFDAVASVLELFVEANHYSQILNDGTAQGVPNALRKEDSLQGEG